jgi:methanogenic corrinoid protein MtbC1
MMTTTMEGMEKVVRLLEEQNIRQSHKVIIGGAPITQSFADKIGADAYAYNAADAVRIAKLLVA